MRFLAFFFVWRAAALLLEGVVLRRGYPHDDVGPETERTAQQGYQEEDSHHRGVDAEVFCQPSAHAGYLAVGGAAGEATDVVVVFHDDVWF